jgi:hypothetical protein
VALLILARLLLDRPTWTFASSRIGLGALTTQGQAFAVSQATVATEIHEALDVHVNFAAQVALDRFLGDFVANLIEFFLVEVGNFGLLGNAYGLADVFRR